MAVNILFNRVYEAVSVERLGRNPNCSLAKISLAQICVNNLLKIIFSNTLENDVNKEIGL
ncbi:hypothetical protein B7P43_G04397 [Cryptotermes secundus]|uniref:Uncharacterized protein n=1 Tax=Cryptotermes secundus TaxID=105785 RepID=A0A2J7PZZ0_9NEOP|nr:hypothetical protein B7P43_G04397 [Cryptotermes secundus]